MSSSSDDTTGAPAGGAGGTRRIVGDVTGFAGSQYFLRFATLVKGFVVARVLGPEGNGLWQHFVIISEYCTYSHGGILPGLNKALGHRIGESDEEGARRAREAGTGGVLVLALVMWGGLVTFVAVRWGELSVWDRYGLPVVGLVVLFDQLHFTYSALLRAYSRIGPISVAATAFALSNLVVSLSLLPTFRLFGLLAGWAITRVATTLWLVHRSGFGFRPSLHGATLRLLLATGFPIFLFHLTRVGLRNIDRVLVDTVLDKSQLGIYAIAVTLSSLVRYGADAVGFVIYPLFLRAWGRRRDPRALEEHLVRPSELLALAVPIVLGFSWLVLHLPVLWLLPEYVASIDLFRMLTVAMAFACLAVLPGFYLMAIDRQNWLVPMGLGVIAFDFLVGREMIAAGWGLPGVAATMGAGSFVYCTAVLLYAGYFAVGGIGRATLWIARLYLPIAYLAGVVAALRWLVPRTPLAGLGEAPRAAVEGGIFLAVSLPLLAAFERRHGIIRRLRSGSGPTPPPPREAP